MDTVDLPTILDKTLESRSPHLLTKCSEFTHVARMDFVSLLSQPAGRDWRLEEPLPTG